MISNWQTCHSFANNNSRIYFISQTILRNIQEISREKYTTCLFTCCIPRFGSFQRRFIASLRGAIDGKSSRDSSRMWQISFIFSLLCWIRRKRCTKHIYSACNFHFDSKLPWYMILRCKGKTISLSCLVIQSNLAKARMHQQSKYTSTSIVVLTYLVQYQELESKASWQELSIYGEKNSPAHVLDPKA